MIGKNMEQFYSTVGIEIECHLVDKKNQPVSITQKDDLQNEIINYLETHNLPTFSLEPHASLIEFKTNPHQSKELLFNEIDLIYDIQKIAKKYNYNILFQGLNPHADLSKQLHARKHFPCSNVFCYASAHINFNIKEEHHSDLFQILDLMQQWCMPFSVLMQSSPLLAQKRTHCHSSRHVLVSGILGPHFDFLPKSLMSWEKIAAFDTLLKQSNKDYMFHGLTNPVQHLLRPKKMGDHKIIEIRFLDTSNADSLKTTIELMAQILDIIANKPKRIPVLFKDDLLLKMSMHQISHVGRYGLINLDYNTALSIEAWSEQHLAKLSKTLHQQFMHALSKPTMRENILKRCEASNLVTYNHI